MKCINNALCSLEYLLCRIGDFVFTKHCFGCNELMDVFSNAHFCTRCKQEIEETGTKTFLNYARREILPVYFYGGSIRKALVAFKYENNRLCGIFFAEKMAEKIKQRPTYADCDLVVYVPCFCLKGKREYNQAEFLAKRVARRLEIPLGKNYLIKTADKISQTKIKSRKKRIANVKGIYRVSEEYEKDVKDKKILLIDDISTTGATISNCIEALLAAGAKDVVSATVAKTSIKGYRPQARLVPNNETLSINKEPRRFINPSEMNKLYVKYKYAEKIKKDLGFYIER